MKKYILVLLLPLLVSVNANALFELRAGYGVQTPAETNYSAATLTTMTGFNLDAIVELPMVPFGFGLRYENMGFDVDSAGVSLSSKMVRTSVLVNYRFIDLFAYFGIIGTVGLVNDAEIDLGIGGINKYDSDLTFSVGVEGGLSFGLFMVGAELGYLSANFERSATQDLDLSGVYAKALVGVGF